MAKCDYPGCENREALPFTCSYCKKNFCREHRLPENHNCENLHLAISKKVSTVMPDTSVKVSKIGDRQSKKEKRKRKIRVRRTKENKRETDFYEIEPDYYSTDYQGNVYTTKTLEKDTIARLYSSVMGDYFTFGREYIDFLVGSIIVMFSFTLVSMFISRVAWIYILYFMAVVMICYFATVYPKKWLAKRKIGFESRYLLSKMGILITLITSISPFKLISPGSLIIPEINLMSKKQRGIISISGIITNLVLGIIFLLIGLLVNIPPIPMLFYNAAFIASQFLIMGLIPFRFTSGRDILEWHWAIYTTVSILSLGLFISSIVLGLRLL
ncbi:MAG: hypothetical protein FK734_05715 [Asgard group archaeon]|nr:hypothetical protein [Asgard group archaeon]